MPETIITIYCFFDELLKAIGHKDDPQTAVTTAEIMTIATVAAELFTGNQQRALEFMTTHGYVKPFSKSRFNRRLHRIPEALWQFALSTLAQIHQNTQNQNQNQPAPWHIVDTFPLPACRNIRIRRCHLYRGESYRGYCASKREYYFGLKVCVIVNLDGAPIEFLLAPAATADIVTLRSLPLNLPEGSTLLGDMGFLDREFETALWEEAGLRLVVPRRKNMKDQLDGCLQYICSVYRKRVETTFSLLAQRLARSVHAVTVRGFELKACLTILAFAITR